MIRTPPAGYHCPTPPVDVDGLLCAGQSGGGGGGGHGSGGLHHVSTTDSREFLLNHCSPTDPTATGPSGQGAGGLPGNGRVLSRNANGTIAMTSQPTNESELQLYRVLQRANLLSYYDTFIGQGGDDVQQLCEAGEEEFLEIMALVGMASKPLHVRRLQKALQEWVNNPAMFQTPLIPPSIVAVPTAPPQPPLPHPPHPSQQQQQPSMASMSMGGSRPMNLSHQSHHNHLPPPPPTRPSPPMSINNNNNNSSINISTVSTPLPPTSVQSSSSANSSNNNMNMNMNMNMNNNNGSNSQHPHPMPTSPSPLASAGTTTMKESAPSPNALQQMQQSQAAALMAQANGATPEKEKLDSCPPFYLFFKGSDPGSNADYSQPGSPLQLTPVLVESQIQRLSEAAEMLIKALPPFEPKPQNSKKKICKELEYVISMCDEDPRRMDEIRKYAAIYGRFDCKRKPEKPLTLHEVSVNEAAAQICRHIPALLTRRDELFPLARQVVRDSGYQYSKGHSRHYGMSYDGDPMVGGGHGGKRSRLHDMHGGGGGGSPDSSNGGHKMSLSGHGHSELTRLKRQERLETLGDELRQLNLQQEELRARLTLARDSQDYQVAQQLQQQLEQLNAHQVQMMAEQSELVKRLRQSRYYSSKGNGRMSSCSDPDPERPDTDDTDSQYSFSNTSSPSQDVHDSSSQDYPTTPATSSDLRIAPVQMQDIFPLKGSNGSTGGVGKKGCGSSGGGAGSAIASGGGGGVSGGGGTPHITKQMMQETLMDEGLRVVKELSSQIKEEPDSMVQVGGVPGLTLSMAMAMAAASEGLPHHHHHHSHHSHSSHHSHHGHHGHHGGGHQASSAATSPVLGPYGGRYGPPPPSSCGGGGGGGCSSNNAVMSSSNGPLRDRDSRQNGQTSGNGGGGGDNSHVTEGADGGSATSVSSSDVEKAAASTINALLSLSQNAGSGRSSGSASIGLKQELPSPTKSTD